MLEYLNFKIEMTRNIPLSSFFLKKKKNLIDKIPFYYYHYFYQVNRRLILFSEIVSPRFCSTSPLNSWLFYPLENLSVVCLAYKNRGSDSQMKMQRQRNLIPLSNHPRKSSSKIFTLVPSNIRRVWVYCASSM